MNYVTRTPIAPLYLVEIGEAARSLGVTPRTLRHYQEQGLIRSHRLARNVRGYDFGTLERLKAIVALRAVGLTIAAIRTILMLHHDPDAQVKALRATLDDALRDQQAQIDRLKALASHVGRQNVGLPPEIAGLRAISIEPAAS